MANPYFTYIAGTEKEIEELGCDSRTSSNFTYGAVGELVGAYVLCSAFPLVSIYLAADGIARLVNKNKDGTPGPGLVGLIRENLRSNN
jgi:hypothetical protein